MPTLSQPQRPFRVAGRRLVLIAVLVVVTVAYPLASARAVPCDAYQPDPASIARYRLPVVVAMDEAWRASNAAGAERAARDLMAEVDRIMGPTGIDLEVTGFRKWATEGLDVSMQDLVAHLDETIPAEPGVTVIGLTGLQRSRVDGVAHQDHVHVVARRHPGRPERDAIVVAHELGHLLGADHHRCTHDFLCVMAKKGFGLPPWWCGHHILEIQLQMAELQAA